MADVSPVVAADEDEDVGEPKSPTPTQSTSVSSSSPSSSTAIVAELLQAAQSRPVSCIDDKIKELKLARARIKLEKKHLGERSESE